jgi:MYXO-CTERM domain-containing protein
VIEVSTNGGSSWKDISTWGDPGYGGTIGDPSGQAHNALHDRVGYIGTNASWPAMDKVEVDLGTALAGKTIRLRFRVGTDDAQGETGWQIDDIELSGLTNSPFPSLVDDKSSCGAPPIADAGPDRTVEGGSTVTLDGSQSFDPASLPLAHAWHQTSGPHVVLSGASTATPSFTAPSTDVELALTFQLTVDDGKAKASDLVKVVVLPGGVKKGGDAGPALVAGGGCGCRTTGEGAPAGGGLALAGVIGAFLARRRRLLSR